MFPMSAIIDRVRNSVDENGKRVVPDGTLATQGYLRLESNLNQTSSQVNFNVLQNVGVSNDTEVRLKQTDLFTITGIGFFVLKAGTTTVATQPQIAQSWLYTSPNPTVFLTAGESAAIQALYNGRLLITVDRKQLLPNWDLMRHLTAGFAQKGVGSSAANNVPYQFDSYDGPNQGFSPLDPQITISGAGENNISIQLPNSTNTSGTNSQNFAVLVLRGILWQGGSKLSQ